MSVVIPTHNFAHGVEATIDCVLRQRDVSLELIIVDDGSTDGTASVLADISDPRVRVITNGTAGGAGAARNAGLAEARGEWIAFLDQDDLWSPDKLSIQLDTVLKAGADFSYCGVATVNGTGGILDLSPAPDPRDVKSLIAAYCAIPNPCSNVLARTDVARRIGGLDPNLSYIADWDFAMRLAQNAVGAASSDYLVAWVRQAESMSGARAHGAFAELAYLRGKIIADGGSDKEIDMARFARFLARAHRSRGQRLRASALYLRGGLQGRDAGCLVRSVGVLFGETVMRDGRRACAALGLSRGEGRSVDEHEARAALGWLNPRA